MTTTVIKKITNHKELAEAGLFLAEREDDEMYGSLIEGFEYITMPMDDPEANINGQILLHEEEGGTWVEVQFITPGNISYVVHNRDNGSIING